MINRKLISDNKLLAIADKIEADMPINEEDALYLLQVDDINGLGVMANFVKEKHNGNKVYYTVNMNINYTNICQLRCPLCAFSRNDCDKDAYVLTLKDIEKKVKSGLEQGIEEVHIVGGLHKNLEIEFFEEMLRTVKRIDPNLFIVAFTAVEYDFFSRVNDLDVKYVIQRLIDAGLGAIPGGGAEIFSEDIRSWMAPKKISGTRWLEIMETAHSLGLKTNASLLYNHSETNIDIIKHLQRIRLLQYKTNGFKTFIPLPFHQKNTNVEKITRTYSGVDTIRLFATIRIYLHNIPHLKALWMYLGEKMAQVLLDYGVDDFGGTYIQEKIVHSAGAKTNDSGTINHLKYIIKNAGKEPVKTKADYS